MLKSRVSSIVLATLCVSALTACSIAKDASETRDTTKQMKETTDHVSKRTDDLETELTTKESYAIMTLNLDNLFSRLLLSNYDGELNAESDMLLYAGATIYSMLFQYWKGDYNENLAELDQRFKLSEEILIVRSLKHIPRDFKVNVLRPDPSYKAIASLGVKLGQMSNRYSDALSRYGLSKMSLYDVVMLALKDRGQLLRTEQLPEAVAMVLKYRQEFQYMIQLRHNYIPMVVMTRMSDFQDQSELGRLKSFAYGQSLDLGIDDARGKNSVDEEQLKEWTQWLNEALETRQALRDMGIAPEYNKVFKGVVAGVDFGQKKLLAMPLDSMTPRQKLFRNFAEAYVKVAAAM